MQNLIRTRENEPKKMEENSKPISNRDILTKIGNLRADFLEKLRSTNKLHEQIRIGYEYCLQILKNLEFSLKRNEITRYDFQQVLGEMLGRVGNTVVTDLTNDPLLQAKQIILYEKIFLSEIKNILETFLEEENKTIAYEAFLSAYTNNGWFSKRR